jgi:hypothetical protein
MVTLTPKNSISTSFLKTKNQFKSDLPPTWQSGFKGNLVLIQHEGTKTLRYKNK